MSDLTKIILAIIASFTLLAVTGIYMFRPERQPEIKKVQTATTREFRVKFGKD